MSQDISDTLLVQVMIKIKVGGYQKSLSLQSLQLMTNLATACQSLFTHNSELSVPS